MPDPNPILAEGHTVSVQGSAAALISKFSTLPLMLTATVDYGRFISSSKRQAFSVQAVGKLNLVFDQVTPQFGSLGGGLRRVGRRSGGGFGSVDFERISAGLAFMSRGSNLDLGFGAELSLGMLTFSGRGIGVFVDAYFFEPTDMTGPETLFVVGLGYVHCPITGMRPSVPAVRSVRTGTEVSRPPCAHVDRYREAIKRERKHAVEVCNAGDLPACEAARARVLALSANLTACERGENLDPPSEVNDAPDP